MNPTNDETTRSTITLARLRGLHEFAGTAVAKSVERVGAKAWHMLGADLRRALAVEEAARIVVDLKSGELEDAAEILRDTFRLVAHIEGIEDEPAAAPAPSEPEEIEKDVVEGDDVKAVRRIDVAISAYIEKLSEKVREYHERASGAAFWAPRFEADAGGRRYVRIVSVDPHHSGRCAHSFIDRTNGDVLKPDGWKGPAKHARGNVYSAQNGMEAIGPTGSVRTF